MKTLLFIFMVVVTVSCGSGNENAAAKADSSNVITDSSALMNTDTTSVIGAARVGTGQMRTDTVPGQSNSGK